MKYPQLVPDKVCKTSITLTLYREGLSEDGEPIPAVKLNTRCNWQGGGRAYNTSEKRYVKISGRALFNGDLCEDLGTITGGIAFIFGEIRDIESVSKARNPDGTVNYTEVILK